MGKFASAIAKRLDDLVERLGYPRPVELYKSRFTTRGMLWWWLTTWLKGQPHFVIHDGSYMRRRYILPRNRWLNIYLHSYAGPDPDPALHDHPWDNVTIVLKGGFMEKVIHESQDWLQWVRRNRVAHAPVQLIARKPGAVVLRDSRKPHTIHELLAPKVWTIFITGPLVRAWGFHRSAGWEKFKREGEA